MYVAGDRVDAVTAAKIAIITIEAGNVAAVTIVPHPYKLRKARKRNKRGA